MHPAGLYTPISQAFLCNKARLVFQKRQLMAHFLYLTSFEKIYFYLVLHQQLVSVLTGL